MTKKKTKEKQQISLNKGTKIFKEKQNFSSLLFVLVKYLQVPTL